MPTAFRAAVLSLVGLTAAMGVLAAAGLVSGRTAEILVRIPLGIGVALALYGARRWPDKR